MAKPKKAVTARKKSPRATSSPRRRKELSYCALPEVPDRVLGPNIHPGRAALIRVQAQKWVNGTVLHYYFFDQQSDGEYVYFSDGTREWRTWTADEDQKSVVREAFNLWKQVGIGLEFREVNSRQDAEIRIGFMQGDGAWSYIGRYILNIGANQRTMNFGWNLTGDIDTAVHEIGHTLGFPHEHQNPNAGIVWDEEAVYAALARPPNNWSRDKTYYNIIRKINPDTVQGSNWDSNSIMHYPFGPGLIKQPTQYRNGLFPAPGLSERDETWVGTFYPPMDQRRDPELTPFEAVQLAISEGEQKNFVIRPSATRRYNIRTFGVSDTVMVLFEDQGGELRYQTGDDDSGEDYNASLRVKLHRDRKYLLRIRLYWSDRSGETVIMMW
ncbi:MAG: M12 family metallopeptidase [Acidiferrobacterales bacterium]